MWPSHSYWWRVALVVIAVVIAARVLANRAVDLSPPVVIVALLVGGTLVGIVGALLALPVAALIKILASEFLIRRRVESVRDENASATAPPNESTAAGSDHDRCTKGALSL